MSLIENERTKLLASALDRASTACITVGVFGPLAAALYRLGGTPGPDHAILIGVDGVAWFIAAAVLPGFAHRVLGRLKP